MLLALPFKVCRVKSGAGLPTRGLPEDVLPLPVVPCGAAGVISWVQMSTSRPTLRTLVMAKTILLRLRERLRMSSGAATGSCVSTVLDARFFTSIAKSSVMVDDIRLIMRLEPDSALAFLEAHL